MSNKEKEAINILKRIVEFDKKHRIITDYEQKPLLRDSIEEVLNLIEKQQKRIEEYKKLLNARYYDYISKDKIREIIKHYNNELEHIKNGEEFENEEPMYYWGKVALENLLEEN